MIDLGLRALGFRRLVEWAQRSPVVANHDLGAGEGLDPTDAERIRRYAGSLEIAARYHIVQARCLHRSLALHKWLREEGLPSQLRIGVLKDGNELRAHAWVELGGNAINDHPRAVAIFTPLRRLDAQVSSETTGVGGSLIPEAPLLIQAAKWQ